MIKALMTIEQFKEKYCLMCGTQRCGGIGTEWFEGCKHKAELERRYENHDNDEIEGLIHEKY